MMSCCSAGLTMDWAITALRTMAVRKPMSESSRKKSAPCGPMPSLAIAKVIYGSITAGLGCASNHMMIGWPPEPSCPSCLCPMERELNGNLEPDRSRIVSGLDLWSAKRALARHRIASWRTVRALNVALALIAVLAATDARARALSLFRYEDQAQRHCPADTVVWLDFKKHKYYSR